MCERSGRPDVTSWGTTRESQPGFSHEESVAGEHRSGRPDKGTDLF